MANKCGIYKITSLSNGKIYIGQSKNLSERYKSHLYNLRNNKHGNSHLQSAYNKYGEMNFEYSIIEECLLEDLNEREIYWIGSTRFNDLFNKKEGGNSRFKFSDSTIELMRKINTGRKQSKETIDKRVAKNKGKKRTDEFRKLMSDKYKGIPQPKERVEKMRKTKTGSSMPIEQRMARIGMGAKPICQYELNGNFIREFTSAKQAGNVLGIVKGDITQVCKGKRKTRGGFIFKYKKMLNEIN